jgi:hypothetical protein
MSRSVRRLIRSSQCSATFLAVGVGVLSAALATSAFAMWLNCASNIGPVTVGVPLDRVVGGVSGTKTLGKAPVAIAWGDGTDEAGHLGNIFCFTPPLASTVCSYGVFGPHTYSAVMTGVTIRLQMIGLGGEVLSCTTNRFDVVAAGPPPPPPPGGDVLGNPKLMLSRAHVNVPVMGVIAAFSDSNPSALVSDFTAVIDWGDGTQSDGVVSSSRPSTLDVSVPLSGHTYATRGSVTVSVSLLAPGVAASIATGTVRVGGGHR